MEFSLRSFLLLTFILFSVSACSLTPDNAQAKLNMTKTQLTHLDSKVLLIKPDMDEQAVSEILGDVYRGQGTNRLIWLGPNKNKSSQIAIYYNNGKIFQIRWLELGNFFWQTQWKISS
jgi:hypothetical protein